MGTLNGPQSRQRLNGAHGEYCRLVIWSPSSKESISPSGGKEGSAPTCCLTPCLCISYSFVWNAIFFSVYLVSSRFTTPLRSYLTALLSSLNRSLLHTHLHMYTHTPNLLFPYRQRLDPHNGLSNHILWIKRIDLFHNIYLLNRSVIW